MPEDPCTDRQLEDVVIDCLRRMEREGAAGLQSCCRDHPELEEALRRRIAALEEMNMLDLPEPAPMPSVVGDFELKEVLGRGGMGVVYRAEQTSLGRSVALKLIRRDGGLSQDRMRQRFQREIAAVTRLSHPSIVQVYAAQADADIPFLAMEFVDGAPISELLTRLREQAPEHCTGAMLRTALGDALRRDSHEWNHSFYDRPWETVVLDIVSQVTAGVVHAHDRGVWHRDLKPSNVILTPGGHAKILDFGLATLRGASRMTVTGSPLGSLPYMAPEVLEDGTQRLTEAADVYSLGVILYELLTLRLPHWDESAERLAQRIIKGVAAPPEHWNQTISRGTSLICQHALEQSPAHRFPRPLELWEDLEAQRAGAPIRSRPPGLARRLRRQLTRSPIAAAGIVVVTVVALALTMILKSQGQLDRQQASSGESRATTHESVRRILTLSREALAYLPGPGQRANDESLATAVDLWRPYYQQTPDDVATRLTWARLALGQGRVFQNTGQLSDAGARFREALGIFESEVPRAESDVRLRRDLAATLFSLASVVGARGTYTESTRLLVRCVAALEQLRQLEPGAARHAQDLLTARHSLASTLLSSGQRPAALQVVKESLPTVDEVMDRWPELPRSLEVAARMVLAHGEITTKLGDPAAALDILGPWYQRLTDSAETHSTATLGFLHPMFAHGLARAHQAAGDREQERSLLDECISLQREVVRGYPTWTTPKSNLVMMLQQRAVWSFDGDQPDDGWDDSAESTELSRELVAQEPETVRHLENLVRCLANEAQALLLTDPGEAAFRAEEVLDEYLAELPAQATSGFWSIGVVATVTLARGLALDDDLEASLESLERWVEPLLTGDHGACPDWAGSAWNTRVCADAWNEWLLAVSRSETINETQQEEWLRLGSERMFDLLDRAVDLGYSSLQELTSTESLQPYQDTPQMQAILERIRRG